MSQKNTKEKEKVLDCLRSFMKNEKGDMEDHSRRMFYLITDKAHMIEDCPCHKINVLNGAGFKCKTKKQ